MSFHGSIPPILAAVLVIIAVVLVIKSLIKLAIIVAAIGVVIWALWQFDVISFFALGAPLVSLYSSTHFTSRSGRRVRP